MPIIAAGTHNFTGAFIEADENSYISCEPIDNSSDGTVTGVKYRLKKHSTLNFGYGANDFNIPGSSEGTVDNSQVIGLNGKPKYLIGRTYYVSTAGDDTNSGSSFAPFATIQRFVDEVSKFDLNGQYIGCSIAPGTYTEPIYFKAFTGHGSIGIGGDGSGTVLISVVDNECLYGEFNRCDCSIFVSNITFETTGSYGNAVYLYECRNISFYNVTLNSTASEAIYVYGNCDITLEQITITGNSSSFLYLEQSRVYLFTQLTLSGTQNFSDAFITATRDSEVMVHTTITGTATGKKYDLTEGSKIYLREGNVEANIPGDVAGTVDTQVVLG